jgi:hypothetical protein
VKAGNGDPRLPSYEGEEMEAYLRRLAAYLGNPVKGQALKPMPDGVRMPYREPGEDDEPYRPARSKDGPWEDGR